MDKASFQRMIDDIVKSARLDNIKAEFQRVREDIRSISQHPQAKRARKEAEKRSKKLFGMINDAQKQFDNEVEKAVTRLRQSTTDIESTINTYRKKAAEEFARLEDLIGRRVGAAQKTTAKAKKATKKKKTTAKKTAASKKASSGAKKAKKKTATKKATKTSGKKKSS